MSTQTEELYTRITEYRDEELLFFRVHSDIEVDGIVSDIYGVHINPMFSMKYETDTEGNPADTGRQWHWTPDSVIDEQHYIRTGHIIEIDKHCPYEHEHSNTFVE